MKWNLSRFASARKRTAVQMSASAENNYGVRPRLTNDDYRARLSSWQVPAIKEHFGSLQSSHFIDIGAGDIILGEHQDDLGRPQVFYAQDLSEISLEAGLSRLQAKQIDTSNIVPLVSQTFDFSAIPDGTIDLAFSNSLFSHLAFNSILLCLRNLRPKMKEGAMYLSSMIVVPGEAQAAPYDWSYLGTKGSDVISHPAKDPFHYTKDAIQYVLGHASGFRVADIHDYGHPFQKLVEFVPC